MPTAITSAVSAADAVVFHWVVAHRAALLNQPMVALSHGGALVWVLGTIFLGVVYRGRWPAVYQVMLAIGLAALLADFVAKPVVSRHRPFISFTNCEVMAGRQRSASFPSTHSAGAFAAAFSLGRVFPEVRVTVWILAALVAYSRVYVGVHYPLDVIGGAIIGLAAAAFAMGGTKWRK